MWEYLTAECYDSAGNPAPSVLWRLLLIGGGVTILTGFCWLAGR
jgi:hypothetical protein